MKMMQSKNKKRILLLVAILLSCIVSFGCVKRRPVIDTYIVPLSDIPYPGKVYLTIHSHPQGAKIYSNEKYIGITPVENWNWIINNEDRKFGKITWGEVLFVRDGYLPVKKTYIMELVPAGKKTYRFHSFVMLKRDPTTPAPPVVPSAHYIPKESGSNQTDRQHITIKQEESVLDEMLKAGQVLSIFQSLRPIGQ
jgi:hypothetical protein